MTLAQANAALSGAIDRSAKAANAECTGAAIRGAPAGVSVLLEKGIVTRINVVSGKAETVEGAHIGDTEARIKELYGTRITVMPHRYTNGHYLIINAASPADSMYKIIFETDGKVVTVYRSGRMPSIAYVEGCG